MLQFSFVYPKDGFLFYQDEAIHVSFTMKNTANKSAEYSLEIGVVDYRGSTVQLLRQALFLHAGETQTVSVPIDSRRLGYYGLTVSWECNGQQERRHTGVGITTPHDRNDALLSSFGVS